MKSVMCQKKTLITGYPCSCIIHLIQSYINFKEAVINSCNWKSQPSIGGQKQTSRVVTTVFHNRQFWNQFNILDIFSSFFWLIIWNIPSYSKNQDSFRKYWHVWHWHICWMIYPVTFLLQTLLSIIYTKNSHFIPDISFQLCVTVNIAWSISTQSQKKRIKEEINSKRWLLTSTIKQVVRLPYAWYWVLGYVLLVQALSSFFSCSGTKDKWEPFELVQEKELFKLTWESKGQRSMSTKVKINRY